MIVQIYCCVYSHKFYSISVDARLENANLYKIGLKTLISFKFESQYILCYSLLATFFYSYKNLRAVQYGVYSTYTIFRLLFSIRLAKLCALLVTVESTESSAA